MRYFIFALILSACTASQIAQKTDVVPSGPTKPANCADILKAAGSGCPAPGVYEAVDLSMPVDQKFLDAAKCLGVKTIIRYGDHVNETIKGKTPKAAERKLIQDNGFAELFVFQHNNSKLPTFTAERGKMDAERMWELYTEVPVWYFGVDFDASTADQSKVKAYAVAFKAVADKFGKKVGVYGSGRSLSTLKAAGLAQFFWISMSTGFGGTKEFTASNEWHLLQTKDRVCAGKEGDFNKVNPRLPFYGQWGK